MRILCEHLKRELRKFFFIQVFKLEFNAVSFFCLIAVEIAGDSLSAADFYGLGLSGLGVISGHEHFAVSDDKRLKSGIIVPDIA